MEPCRRWRPIQFLVLVQCKPHPLVAMSDEGAVQNQGVHHLPLGLRPFASPVFTPAEPLFAFDTRSKSALSASGETMKSSSSLGISSFSLASSAIALSRLRFLKRAYRASASAYSASPPRSSVVCGSLVTNSQPERKR